MTIPGAGKLRHRQDLHHPLLGCWEAAAPHPRGTSTNASREPQRDGLGEPSAPGISGARGRGEPQGPRTVLMQPCTGGARSRGSRCRCRARLADRKRPGAAAADWQRPAPIERRRARTARVASPASPERAPLRRCGSVLPLPGPARLAQHHGHIAWEARRKVGATPLLLFVTPRRRGEERPVAGNAGAAQAGRRLSPVFCCLPRSSGKGGSSLSPGSSPPLSLPAVPGDAALLGSAPGLRCLGGGKKSWGEVLNPFPIICSEFPL